VWRRAALLDAAARCVPVIALVGFVMVPVSSAHADVSSKRCALVGSQTVLRTEHARIYRQYGSTYGCLYARDRRYRIATYSRDDYGQANQRNVRVAGRYVAFEDFYEGKDGYQYHVIVSNLQTGRRVCDIATGPTPDNIVVSGYAYGIGHTTSIQLRATGGVAWIARNAYATGPRYEVRKRDRGTDRDRGPDGDLGTTLLAQGSDIAPASLRLHGEALTWLQDAVPHDASLR
jgi:hypothetical protein